MDALQVVGSDAADIIGRNFWARLAPVDDDGADGIGCGLSHAMRAAHTQAGGKHAGMELASVKSFRVTFAAALDDIDQSALSHLYAPCGSHDGRGEHPVDVQEEP